MSKVAKLVRVTLTTRVIVDENANESDIIDLALPRLVNSLTNDTSENIDDIIDDVECPYDSSWDEYDPVSCGE